MHHYFTFDFLTLLLFITALPLALFCGDSCSSCLKVMSPVSSLGGLSIGFRVLLLLLGDNVESIVFAYCISLSYLLLCSPFFDPLEALIELLVSLVGDAISCCDAFLRCSCIFYVRAITAYSFSCSLVSLLHLSTVAICPRIDSISFNNFSSAISRSLFFWSCLLIVESNTLSIASLDLITYSSPLPLLSDGYDTTLCKLGSCSFNPYFSWLMLSFILNLCSSAVTKVSNLCLKLLSSSFLYLSNTRYFSFHLLISVVMLVICCSYSVSWVKC